MARYEPGLTFSASPQAIEIVRQRLERSGVSISESAALSLVEAVLAVEGPRMQAVERGILHGSLETIRQTAEVALSALKEGLAEPQDLVGVVREDDDPRPVFKRRGR